MEHLKLIVLVKCDKGRLFYGKNLIVKEFKTNNVSTFNFLPQNEFYTGVKGKTILE